LAKSLQTAYLNATKSLVTPSKDPVVIFGTSGKGEFNALDTYLDNAAKAALDISQSERDDVQSEKVLKVAGYIAVTAAYKQASNLYSAASTGQVTFKDQTVYSKFVSALSAFEQSVASMSLPQVSQQQSMAPVPQYALFFVGGLNELKVAVSHAIIQRTQPQAQLQAQAPVAQAPVAQAPVAQAPVAAAPVTVAPVTVDPAAAAQATAAAQAAATAQATAAATAQAAATAKAKAEAAAAAAAAKAKAEAEAKAKADAAAAAAKAKAEAEAAAASIDKLL
jgi:hypothetical protein